MGSFTDGLARQFGGRSVRKPDHGLRDVKFYRFPSVVVHLDGKRELVWTVKALPFGTAHRDAMRATALADGNNQCNWKNSAGDRERLGPQALSDAEVKEYLAAHKQEGARRSKVKETAALRKAPAAIFVSAPDGTASVVAAPKPTEESK